MGHYTLTVPILVIQYFSPDPIDGGICPKLSFERSLMRRSLPDFLDWRVPLPALPKALPASSACYCYTTS